MQFNPRTGPRFHEEAGKGSAPRPSDHDKFKANWDAIFGKKEEKPNEKEKTTT
jgi:hypothetical protein